jgi:hypothetical protein
MTQTYKYSFWLRFDEYGTLPKISKNPPPLSMGERAMKCAVALPVSIFNRPQLVANITVEHEQKDTIEIDLQAMETALTGVVGCDVIMEVVPVETDDGGAS